MPRETPSDLDPRLSVCGVSDPIRSDLTGDHQVHSCFTHGSPSSVQTIHETELRYVPNPASLLVVVYPLGIV